MDSASNGPGGVGGIASEEKEGGEKRDPPGNLFHFPRPKEDEGYAEQDPTRRYGRVRVAAACLIFSGSISKSDRVA